VPGAEDTTDNSILVDHRHVAEDAVCLSLVDDECSSERALIATNDSGKKYFAFRRFGDPQKALKALYLGLKLLRFDGCPPKRCHLVYKPFIFFAESAKGDIAAPDVACPSFWRRRRLDERAG
jgi:hypothetical protein